MRNPDLFDDPPRDHYELGMDPVTGEPDRDTAWQMEWDGHGGPPRYDFRPRDPGADRRKARDEARRQAGLRVRRRWMVRTPSRPKPWLVTELGSGTSRRFPSRQAAEAAAVSYQAFCVGLGKVAAACKIDYVPEPDVRVGVLR